MRSRATGSSVFVHTCGCACISRNGRWACSWLKSDVRNGFYTSFYVYDGSGAFVAHVHPTECNCNMRWYYTPRGKAVTKMRMTRKSPTTFLDAKSCVESVSEVFFEVPARPDELGTLLLAHDSRNHTAQYVSTAQTCN